MSPPIGVCAVVPLVVDNKFGINFKTSSIFVLMESGINANRSSMVPVFAVRNSVILVITVASIPVNKVFDVSPYMKNLYSIEDLLKV